MMVPASVLATCRTQFANAFNESCDVYRQTQTATDTGGTAVVQNQVATLLCRVGAPKSNGREQSQAGPVKSVDEYELLFAYDADVRTTDRLVVNGKTFEVVSIDPVRTDALCLTVTCKRKGG